MEPTLDTDTRFSDCAQKDLARYTSILFRHVMLKDDSEMPRDISEPVPAPRKLGPRSPNDPGCVKPPALDERHAMLLECPKDRNTVKRRM